MVSTPSKLKMFTGSVCVLLTSVSLKLIKIKIELIYATTSSWEKKTKWRVKGKWRRLISFFFLWSKLIFLVSEFNFIRSELIRSDFCTCSAKMFVCPVPKISHFMMKWCRRASHLTRFTLWNNGRRATQRGTFTLWHDGRLATQLSRFTLDLWHNRR